MMIDKAQRFWDKHSTTYENTERRFEPLFKEALAKTKGYLNADDKVLDFGCASGIKTIKLASGVKHILGLDYSVGMIAEAVKKKDEAQVTNCTFMQGTIFDNRLGEASFDKIVSFGVIHLLENGGEVIQRIRELLKPGGIFVSTTPSLKEKMDVRTRLEFSAFRVIQRARILPLHLNMYTSSAVEQLIAAQGFKIIESQKIFKGVTVAFVVAKRE